MSDFQIRLSGCSDLFSKTVLGVFWTAATHKKLKFRNFDFFNFRFFFTFSFVIWNFVNFGGFWSGMASLGVSDIDICKSPSVCKEIHKWTRSTTIFKSIRAKMRHYARGGWKTWPGVGHPYCGPVSPSRPNGGPLRPRKVGKHDAVRVQTSKVQKFINTFALNSLRTSFRLVQKAQTVESHDKLSRTA